MLNEFHAEDTAFSQFLPVLGNLWVLRDNKLRSDYRVFTNESGKPRANCGRPEEATVLISTLLLRMRGTCAVSIRMDFLLEWMECTERNLITRVLTYHEKLTQSTALGKEHFSPWLISPVEKALPHSVFFSGKLFYKSNSKVFSYVCIAW